MIKETESKSYMEDKLKGKAMEEMVSFFLETFRKNTFHSNDLYPEIFLLCYRNDHPFLSEKYQGYLTYDLAMEWMPYDDYREGKEELDKAIDQENFHCYQLHLYLYFDSKEEKKLSMIKEFRKLSSSYQEKEKTDWKEFSDTLFTTFHNIKENGPSFLGYELDFTDAQ